MEIITRSLSKIEEYAEGKLFDKGQYSGAKFFLANNFKGWSDKPCDDNSDTMEKLDAVLNELSSAMTKGGKSWSMTPLSARYVVMASSAEAN